MFEYGQAPQWVLVCMGYEQEIETDKTVLQILYTDFFSIHATFFLKKKASRSSRALNSKLKHYSFTIICTNGGKLWLGASECIDDSKSSIFSFLILIYEHKYVWEKKI